MSCLGNIIWIIFGGLINSIGWILIGGAWCLTIVGIPIGKQCFKMAALEFAPFGKEIISVNDSNFSLLANILWIIFGGFILCIGNLISGIILCLTIVGIPFGLQFFKLAKLSLCPFGKKII